VRAVDTNILARYYLGDDPAQSRIAANLLEGGGLFVPKTVLLELEWVLRSVAEQPAGKVLDCLAHLAALSGITIEDHEQVEMAIALGRQGIDFADALHLCASAACTEFLTFDDRGFVRRAQKLRLKPQVARPAAS
jgi:predicted nucleic-acid-binding protein